MEKEKKKPIENIRVGSVQAAVWEHEGPKGKFTSTTFSRSYEKNGEFKNAYDFKGNELADLQRAAKEAQEFEKAYKLEKGSEALNRFEARNEQSHDNRGQGLER